MSEGEAEKKRIARLDFNVDDALKNLDKVSDRLNKLSKNSETAFKNIEKNFDKVFTGGDYSKQIQNLEKKMMKYEQLNETQQKSISTSLHKHINKRYTMQQDYYQKLDLENQKHRDKMQEEEQKITAIKIREEEKRKTKALNNNKEIEKSTESLYDKITQYAKTYVIYQGFNMLKKGIQETIDEMVNVQYRMVEIDRVLNESSLNIDEYRDKLIQLAYDYGNVFDDVSDIALRLAKAGLNSQQVLSLTEKTLLALNTAELNATQATDDMIAVMSQWNLITDDASQTAKDYGDIIDKVNKVADNFPTTSEDILNALKKTSAAFNLAGASIDETIATIVAAEKASQRGGKVIGTALSNIVQQLKAEGKINIMESLGINLYKDATKTEFNSIIDILGQLSEKMQDLKNRGKESSVEMQKLLEVFTVFRRNVGAGLLTEMAGEESTYAQVLTTSINSVGYSLQENEKHMKTAKAAQAQFNAELLKLKTTVWDAGLEDVFRSMLLLGSDLSKGITNLVDKFGALPVALATVTLAFSLFSKKMKLAFLDLETGTIKTTGIINSIKKMTLNITAIPASVKSMANVSNISFKTMIANVKAYGIQLDVAKLKTMALKAATMALNIAYTVALTAGIMLVTSALQEMINAQRTAIELQKQAIESNEDEISKQEERVNSINELKDAYDELSKKENRTPEDVEKLYELQTKIKQILGDQADTIDLINGKYEDQKKLLEERSIEEQKELVRLKEITYEQKANAGVGYELPSWTGKVFGQKDYEKVIKEYGNTGLYKGSLSKTLQNADVEEAIELFTEWEKNLRSVQDQSVELANTYAWVTENLNNLKNQIREVEDAEKDLSESQAELQMMEIFTPERITNAEDFRMTMERLKEATKDSGMEEFWEEVMRLAEQAFPEFANQAKIASGELEDAQSTVDGALTALQNLSDQYAILTAAQEEYNASGEFTIETLSNLINNDLLQYLSLENGQLQINANSMLDLAEAKKIEAIEALQSAAANDIEKIAIGNVGSVSSIAKGAIASVGDNSETAGNQMQTATSKANNFAASLQNVANAAKGKLGAGVDPNTFQKQANAIISTYEGIAKTIANINITGAGGSSSTRSGGSGSSSSSAAYAAEKEAEAAAKAEEDAYKKRLEAFKNYIKEKERLEKRWVDKQKDLGLLSNSEFMYIIQQRIKRYQEYIDAVKKSAWIHEEDKLELQKEYSEKIEDLQLDYFDYLKDKLNEEIDALKKANEEKIDLIKEEADARIEALRAVENENDRIRKKEEYEKKRAEYAENVSYWEQRTGREAQQALKEAKKKLQELDEEWQKQKEDWSIEDQIKAIEEERDAQIKAIEEAQEAEIKAMQDIYDAKVKLFAETGQIIYEGTVIQSKALYNQYKKNFIDPIKNDLQQLNAVAVAVSEPEPVQQYETYLIKSGDTLSKIAARYGTTVDKIMEANPYIKNRNLIYAGKTLEIPKFHEGGIFGGVEEGTALLKKRRSYIKT